MGHLKLNRRSGFTIIELLTVIGIIALMTSLLVGASFRFVGSARETATATTVLKASGIIQDRVRAFQEFDFTEAARALTISTNFPTQNISLAKVLVKKARFKRAFPQAFAEMDDGQKLLFFGTTTLPTGNHYEPGIVLYGLLTKGETFGAPTPGLDTFVGSEIKNSSDTGNLPCLVDAWGEPLRFYRWPTRLIRCGEQNYSGNTTAGYVYDDYNQNGVQDAAGSITSAGVASYCPAIRPCPALPAPTPASLLISNLPPFNVPANPVPSGSYVLGPDNIPGSTVTGVLGWPDTDDPEPMNFDPDDPSFLLATSAWISGQAWPTSEIASGGNWVPSNANPWTNASTFVNGSIDLNKTSVIGGYHDISTYSSPLIVSAGPDKKLGLYEPTDVPTPPTGLGQGSPSQNFGYLAAPMFQTGGVIGNALFKDLFDDITNLNQRAGGR